MKITFSETTKEIFTAFHKVQQAIVQPAKSADNTFFKTKYVKLELVEKAIKNACADSGLSFTQNATFDKETGFVEISTLLQHSSGQWLYYEPMALRPSKADVQGSGSAITYGRRYTLSAIFGITSDEDDDGNEASRSTSKSAEMIDQVTYNGWMSRLEKVSAMTGWSVSSLVNRISKEIGKAPEVALVTDKVKVDKIIEMSEAKAREEMMKGEQDKQ